MRCEKGEEFGKMRIRTRVDRDKKTALRILPSMPLKVHLDSGFYNIVKSNHMLVGGVSVNSLCQQSRLFSLSVNRYSRKKNTMEVNGYCQLFGYSHFYEYLLHILFHVLQKIEIHSGLEWHDNFHFWVNYVFNNISKFNLIVIFNEIQTNQKY